MNTTLPIYLAKLKFSLELFVIDWLQTFFKNNTSLCKEKKSLHVLLDTLSAFFTYELPGWSSEPVHFDPLPLNYLSLDNQQLSVNSKEKILQMPYQPQLKISGKVDNALAGAFSYRLENPNFSELERGEIRLYDHPFDFMQKKLEFRFSRLPGPGLYYIFLFPRQPDEQSEQKDQFGYYAESTKYILTVL